MVNKGLQVTDEERVDIVSSVVPFWWDDVIAGYQSIISDLKGRADLAPRHRDFWLGLMQSCKRRLEKVLRPEHRLGSK